VDGGSEDVQELVRIDETRNPTPIAAMETNSSRELDWFSVRNGNLVQGRPVDREEECIRIGDRGQINDFTT
jgi:hypothetical protein